MKIPVSRIEKINHPDFSSIELFIKRDDLIDEMISGNKLYKLTYNLAQAKKTGYKSILTFGGAYSNHIAATAAICNANGISSKGIIRGERPKKINPTLVFAEKCGMELEFVSRAQYRSIQSLGNLGEAIDTFPESYIIPEGGANLLGILGAKHMLDERTMKFDHIVLAIGTGTTFAGVTKAAQENQHVIGIPVLKHHRIIDDILEVYPSFKLQPKNKWSIINGYHFGGYAKWDHSLVEFIQDFHSQTNIRLDPIYTGKSMFALGHLVNTRKIAAGSKVLFIHTGGLQGAKGFEERFGINLYST